MKKRSYSAASDGDWARPWPASEQCKTTQAATEHCCWRLKKQLLCPCCTMPNLLSSTWWWDRVHHVSVTASHIHHHTGHCRQDGDSHCCVIGLPMCCIDTSSYTELSYHHEHCYQLLYSPPPPNLSWNFCVKGSNSCAEQQQTGEVLEVRRVYYDIL